MEKKDSKKKVQCHSLTVNKNISINEATKQALDFSIEENDEITNIAITGNYGAGKSSLIESYKEDSKKKFIHISLAEYSGISDDKDGLKINTIEGKIINQLLHQIDPNKLRKSNFKTLDTESLVKPMWITFYLGSVIFLSLYIFNFEALSNDLISIKLLFWATNFLTEIFATVVLVLFILYGIFYLLRLQKDFSFIKNLKLKANNIETEINIFSQNEDTKVSYFDRYLDDILYLFKQSDADVIVFEDIERFNNSKIFERLKELNIVVNRKSDVCDEKKLVFMYLVKDDLFESQDRTKFFDFIIPIVPVLTSSNSYDQLTSKLTCMDLINDFSEPFLFEISLYIDDMRLLNNICNEYYNYRECLNYSFIHPEKLFSILVYKNLFPQDFSLLLKKQGFLNMILSSRDQQLDKKMKELELEKSELNEKIVNARKEEFRDLVELYGSIFKIPDGMKVVKVNGKSQSDFKSYYQFIEEVLNEKNTLTVFGSYNEAEYESNPLEVTIDEIFPEKNSLAFKNRIKNTENKILIKRIEDKLEKINTQLLDIENQKLSDIYNSPEKITNFILEVIPNDKEKESYTQFLNNRQFDLIPFLVRNEYVDENYEDYLTYFYGNTLSISDKEFIRDVITGRSRDFYEKLKNTNEINNRIVSKYFRQPAILNFDLFMYLLRASDNKDFNANERLRYIFEQEDVLEFLTKFYSRQYQYLERTDVRLQIKLNRKPLLRSRISPKKDIIKISDSLTSSKSNKITPIYRDGTRCEEQQILRQFLYKWLEYNPELLNLYIFKNNSQDNYEFNNFIISLLALVDLSECDLSLQKNISSYIEKNVNVFSDELNHSLLNLDESYDNFTDNLLVIGLKIPHYSNYDKRVTREENSFLVRVIDFIYQNKLYEMNEFNLNFFIHWYSENLISDEIIEHHNFELINTKEIYSSILEYCNEDIKTYINAYLELSNNDIQDSPQYIEQLLNNQILFEDSNTLAEDEDGYDDTISGDRWKIVLAALKNNHKIEFKDEKFNNLSEESLGEFVAYLVDEKKAIVNTDIVLTYFNYFSQLDFPRSFIDFINECPDFEFDKSQLDNCDIEFKNKFLEKIIKSNNLNDTTFKNIFSTINSWKLESNEEILGLSTNKIRILIDLKQIEMTEESLQIIRSYYPSELNYFIKHDFTKYIELIQNNIVESECIGIVTDNSFTFQQKIKVLDCMNHISLKDISVCQELISYILDYKFNSNDFDFIIESNFFDKLSNVNKIKVEELVGNKIALVINKIDNNMSMSLFERLFSNPAIQDDVRKELLLKNIFFQDWDVNDLKDELSRNFYLFNLEEIMSILEKIEYSTYLKWAKVFERLNRNSNGTKCAYINDDSFNNKLSEYLVRLNVISSYSKKTKGIRLNSKVNYDIKYQ